MANSPAIPLPVFRALSNVSGLSAAVRIVLFVFAYGLLPVSGVHSQQPESESYESPINRFEELQLRQFERGLLNYPVETEAQLVFTSDSWKHFFVQQGRYAMMVGCDVKTSLALSKLKVGTLLRIRGATSIGDYAIHLDSYEIIDANKKLEAIPLNDLSEDLHVQMNGLAKLNARIHEVLIEDDMLLLFAWIGFLPVEIELYETTPVLEGIKYWNETIDVEGCIIRNDAQREAMFVVRMMDKSQIEGPAASFGDSSTPEFLQTEFNYYQGQVLFSGYQSRLVVSIDGDLRFLYSRFAYRIEPGDEISVCDLQSRNPSGTASELISSLIVKRKKLRCRKQRSRRFRILQIGT